MSTPSVVSVGQTRSGSAIRIEGRGTMRESPAVHEFAVQVLNQGSERLVIDLADCEYLDSTFLGCLVDLHKRYGTSEPPRFVVSAPAETARRLLAATRLDTLLHPTEERTEFLGESVVLPPQVLEAIELGRHVMECHRRLAEIAGPNQAIFERIADQLAQELVGSRNGDEL